MRWGRGRSAGHVRSVFDGLNEIVGEDFCVCMYELVFCRHESQTGTSTCPLSGRV